MSYVQKIAHLLNNQPDLQQRPQRNKIANGEQHARWVRD